VDPSGVTLEEELDLGSLDAEARQLGAGRAGVASRTLLPEQLLQHPPHLRHPSSVGV
jgi:hypothetical protein